MARGYDNVAWTAPAAGTDAWTGLRAAVARRFGRGDGQRERAEHERLEQTTADPRSAQPPRSEHLRIRQEATWQATGRGETGVATACPAYVRYRTCAQAASAAPRARLWFTGTPNSVSAEPSAVRQDSTRFCRACGP